MINHGDRLSLGVRDGPQLTEIIVPFFEKYPLLTVKKQDFKYFKQVLVLMDNKAHLTKEGLEVITAIQKKMNRKGDLKGGFDDIEVIKDV